MVGHSDLLHGRLRLIMLAADCFASMHADTEKKREMKDKKKTIIHTDENYISGKQYFIDYEY